MFSPINHLNVQYRMHPDILMFPNREFYENRLTTAHCVMNRTFPLHPYGMFSLQCNQNMTQDISRNTYNSEEVLFVMHLLMTIEAIVDQAEFSIGVITPYSRHKSEMIKCFKKRSVDFCLFI